MTKLLTLGTNGSYVEVDVNLGAASGASGFAILDFGTTPGSQYVELNITGQSSIGSINKVKAYLIATSTIDHNITEHAIVPMNIRCGNIVPGVGFTIYASSEFTLTGTFNIIWEWS